MRRLTDVAAVHGKVCGPFKITYDILFKDAETYNSAKETQSINAELFTRIFDVQVDQCELEYYDNGLSVKCTIPRHIPAGNIGDYDLYGEGGALLLQEVGL